MDDKTQELIKNLADKLGTTAEHLWGVLVKQAPISAATDVAVFVVAIVLWSIAYKRLVKWEPEGDGMLKDAAWFGFWVVTVIIGVALACDAVAIVSAFVNPEYWALRQLVK